MANFRTESEKIKAIFNLKQNGKTDNKIKEKYPKAWNLILLLTEKDSKLRP